MKNDLNDIVRRRNEKLNQKPARRRVKVTTTELSVALGPAPRYLMDAVTRAMAIGRSDR